MMTSRYLDIMSRKRSQNYITISLSFPLVFYRFKVIWEALAEINVPEALTQAIKSTFTGVKVVVRINNHSPIRHRKRGKARQQHVPITVHYSDG
jgi:hypothetical protein